MLFMTISSDEPCRELQTKQGERLGLQAPMEQRALLLGAMPSSPPTPPPKQRFQTLKIAQKTPHKVVPVVCVVVSSVGYS